MGTLCWHCPLIKIYQVLKYLNWGQHFLFTDSIILLLLGASFETLPRKTAEFEDDKEM
jgi:hypothetical protein